MNDSIEDRISEIITNNYLVIVEGKKDKKALNNLGVEKVTSLNNRPLFEVIESVEEKEVVILTDLDFEGKKLFNKLRSGLQKRGIKLNNNLRNVLFKSKLRHIEGLDTYIKNSL